MQNLILQHFDVVGGKGWQTKKAIHACSQGVDIALRARRMPPHLLGREVGQGIGRGRVGRPITEAEHIAAFFAGQPTGRRQAAVDDAPLVGMVERRRQSGQQLDLARPPIRLTDYVQRVDMPAIRTGEDQNGLTIDLLMAQARRNEWAIESLVEFGLALIAGIGTSMWRPKDGGRLDDDQARFGLANGLGHIEIRDLALTHLPQQAVIAQSLTFEVHGIWRMSMGSQAPTGGQ